MRFVVLSSSRGTTFQAILDALRAKKLTAECLGLVTDRKDRGCREKAEQGGLPVIIVGRQAGEGKEEYDRRLHEAIQGLGASSWGLKTMTKNSPQPLTTNPQSTTSSQSLILACMGWMFIFSPWFISRWRGRILNVHPALLPKFGGKGMYGDHVHEAVLASGARESGITIHCMDEGVDTGKILLQKKCPVLPGDTVTTLKARVQELEKEWYPKALQMIHEGLLEL